jgi:transcriptional regulator with XRE-family HTH domain
MQMNTTTETENYFERLKQEDADYATYAKRFMPLAEFMAEYEHQKGLQNLTQAEIARRLGTTQSAVSRFESMKHPPSYDLLRRVAQTLGDRLSISPLAGYTFTVPADLRETADKVAKNRGVSAVQLMAGLFREALKRESFIVCGHGGGAVRTLPVYFTGPSEYSDGYDAERTVVGNPLLDEVAG